MRLSSTTLIFLALSIFPASALTAQIETDTPYHPINPVTLAQRDRDERRAMQVLQARMDQALNQVRARILAERSCPIELTANRRPQAAVLYAGNKSSGSDWHQLLNIRIGNYSHNDAAKTVIAADLLLHGYPAGMRFDPVESSSANQQTTETVHVSAPAATGPIDINIRPTQLAIVERIELTRILYSDGTIWQPSVTSTCFASPSLLVQASAR